MNRIAITDFHNSLPVAIFDAIMELSLEIFPPRDGNPVAERERRLSEISGKANLYVLTAFDGNILAGFKLGFECAPEEFYSKLGAVAPSYRRLGIGGEIMKRQHQWCVNRGYKRIVTRTNNQWRDMIILNIMHGFDISDIVLNDYGEQRIVMVKIL